MLALTRKRGEKIIVQLGDAVIEIVVVEVQAFRHGRPINPKVKIGVTAPPHAIIDREEIYLKKGVSDGRVGETA